MEPIHVIYSGVTKDWDWKLYHKTGKSLEEKKRIFTAYEVYNERNCQQKKSKTLSDCYYSIDMNLIGCSYEPWDLILKL